MAHPLLTLALVAGLLPNTALAESGQTVDGRILVDHDFRFRLDVSGTHWRVLPERDIKVLVPDAVAGLMGRDGAYCGMIVEAAPGGTTESWSKALTDNLAVEDRQVEYRRTEPFQGTEAARSMTSGRINDVPMRFQHFIFLRSAHLYQLVCWGITSKINLEGDIFRSAIRGLTLTEGEIRARNAPLLRDAAGPGWRAEGGVFEHASCGFSLEPKAPWHVVTGTELHGMNNDAAGGMAHPHAYLVLLCERAAGVDKDAFLKTLRDNVKTNLGAEPGPGRTVKIHGQAVTIYPYSMEGDTPVTLYHGAFFHEGQAIQLQSWYIGSLAASGEAALPGAYAAIRLMSGPQRRASAADIRARLPHPNTVGSGFSERGGVYRDFVRQFVWETPKSGFWSTETGQTARQRNPNAGLFLEEEGAGLMGMIIVETLDSGVSPRDYHTNVVQVLGGSAQVASQAESITLNKRSALTSRIDATGSPPLTYHLVTQSEAGLGWRFVLWGLPANVADAGALIKDAVEGLVVHPKGLAASTRRSRTHRDHRMGYAFTSPFGPGDPEEIFPAEIRPIGSSAMFSDGQEMAAVFALSPGNGQQDEAWFTDLLTASITSKVEGKLGEKPSRSRTTMAGHDAQQLLWRVGEEQLTVLTFARDRTFYGLVVATRRPGLIAQAKAGFELLP